MGLWKELRRRHVFRVAAAYAATAWLVLQLGSIIFPALQAPAWALPVLIGFVALGFPVALLLAWAFEMTPEGMRRTEPAHTGAASSTGDRRRVGRLLDIVIILILTAAVGVLGWQKYATPSGGDSASPQPSALAQSAEPANSIAVLPFLDLSPKGDQEYFAEGIAEQLLDILAQSTRLEVAARTSAFQFKGHPEDVVDIGKQLHVRHVIEGSVRRDGNRVRITAQLINAATGYHEWSRTYQRQLTDIFTVQDEISKAIADALEVKFGDKARSASARAVDPKTDPQAYDQYLLGRHFLNQRTGAALRKALVHFKKAVAIDPDYAPAYAQISIVYSLLTKGPNTYGDYSAHEANALAKPYLDRAIALAPEAADTQAAQGRYAVLAADGRGVLSHFTKAVAANPSYSDAVTWLAIFQDVFGRHREALATLRAGVQRDPLNWIMNDNYVGLLLEWHRFSEAEAVARQFEGLDHDRAEVMQSDVAEAEGHYADALRHSLEALRDNPGWRVGLAQVVDIADAAGLYREAQRLRAWHDCGVALALAGAIDEAMSRGHACLARYSKDYYAHQEAALLYLLAGHRDEARKQLSLAWNMLKRGGKTERVFGVGPLVDFAALEKEAGESAMAAGLLAKVHDWLNKDQSDASAAGLPENAGRIRDFGMLDIATGKTSRGLEELGKALDVSRPYRGMVLVPYALENSPVFDVVRDDPRFQAVVRRVKARQSSIRADILPVICNWHYPKNGWHPLARTCKGFTNDPQATTG